MFKWLHSATAKVIGVAILALLLGLPLFQIGWLSTERQELRQSTVTKIARGWGGRQVVGGPVLTIPTWRDANPEPVSSTETVLPDTLTMDMTLAVETRAYGIYSVPVYVSTIKLSAKFLPQDLARFRRSSNATWQASKAQLRLPISDLTGLRDVADLQVNGEAARFASSDVRITYHVLNTERYGDRQGRLSTIALPINLDALADRAIDISMTLTLAGVESINVVPLARTTDVRIAAPWGDPSFVGSLLPRERQVGPSDFHAQWRMLELNRGYGQHWGSSAPPDLATSIFGVQLFQPVDLYQRVTRATKYGLLFIGTTFAAFFLFEVLKQLRVHPVQYLLVGAAQTTFFVLLLALAEQIGFRFAYLLAAAAVVVIVGAYAAAILHTRQGGLLLAGILAAVYAGLYALMAAEQYGLLIGALMLLALIALAMYLTRRIDWYAYGPRAGGA